MSSVEHMTEFVDSEGVPFQQRYLVPLPNVRVEGFAYILAMQAGYVREPVGTEFEKLPDEVRHSFREMAAEYAAIVGVYHDDGGLPPYDKGYDDGFEDGHGEGYEEGYDDGLADAAGEVR